ncbi:hypothetical protein IFM47457_04216 [Aspergillus lentulus]|nr:hypothetical protein IFM47457_04216 [Aspergillus lentulus]
MATRLQHHGEVRARRWRPAIDSSRIQMNRHLLARKSSQERLENTEGKLTGRSKKTKHREWESLSRIARVTVEVSKLRKKE